MRACHTATRRVPMAPAARRIIQHRQNIEDKAKRVGNRAPPGPVSQSAEVTRIQARHPWRKRVHDQLLETIDLRRLRSDANERRGVARRDRAAGARNPRRPGRNCPRASTAWRSAKEVINEAHRTRPLEGWLGMKRSPKSWSIAATRFLSNALARLQWYPLAFTSDRSIMGVIERIVAPLAGSSTNRRRWWTRA